MMADPKQGCAPVPGTADARVGARVQLCWGWVCVVRMHWLDARPPQLSQPTSSHVKEDSAPLAAVTGRPFSSPPGLTARSSICSSHRQH